MGLASGGHGMMSECGGRSVSGETRGTSLSRAGLYSQDVRSGNMLPHNDQTHVHHCQICARIVHAHLSRAHSRRPVHAFWPMSDLRKRFH